MVVRQFEIEKQIRRRRWLISAQGWSAATTLGNKTNKESTLKGLGMYVINPFRVELNVYVLIPGLSLRSNLGLKLANAFGVFVQKQNEALLNDVLFLQRQLHQRMT